MERPNLKELSAEAIYALYVEVAMEVEEKSDGNWKERLVAGVHFANDVRYEGKATSDEEWKETVVEIVENGED